eukprot:233534-Alexandrium_andersonii.AAC.1
MSDQVGAWQLLTVSVLVTHPYRFATQYGMCNIDATGWIPADSFLRFAARLCGPDALHTACVALTQINKKDTGTWDGALMVLALICCPEVQVWAAREIGSESGEHFAGVPKGEIGEAC